MLTRTLERLGRDKPAFEKNASRVGGSRVSNSVVARAQPTALLEGTARADLVERLRARDERAFRELYQAYRARLFTFLLRLTHDEALARDLSQETWLRLAANAERLLPESDPAAWLFTVARNLFVSQRRFRLLDRQRLAQLGLTMFQQPLPGPLERASAGQLRQTLERALLALSPSHREVVLLVSIEGFATEQVASMLGTSEMNVRQRLSRARALLRRALEKEAEP